MKKIITILLSTLLALTCLTTNVFAKNTENVPDGSYEIVSGFYQDQSTYNNSTNFYISSLSGLKYFRDLVNGDKDTAVDYANKFYANGAFDWYTTKPFKGKTVILLCDVDLNNETWIPIGTTTESVIGFDNHGSDKSTTYFFGSFSGNNHTIRNLKVDINNYEKSGSIYKNVGGFFGYVPGGTYKDLIFEDVDIETNGSGVGTLIGRSAGDLTINNITLKGNIKVKSMYYTGGLIGHSGDGKYANISDCSIESGTFDSSWDVGSIAGYIGNGSIKNCSVKNTKVTNTDTYTGGIAGSLMKGECLNNTVENSLISSNKSGGILLGRVGENAVVNVLENSESNNNLLVGDVISTKLVSYFYNTNPVVGITVGFEDETNKDFNNGAKAKAGIFESLDEKFVASGYKRIDNLDASTKVKYPYTIGELTIKVVKDSDGTIVKNYNSLKDFRDAVNNGTFQATGYNNNSYTVHLNEDVDLDNEEWNPIGTSSYPFLGKFDGNNHVVKNINVSSGSSVGLFGYAGNGEIGAKFSNLVIDNVTVKGEKNVGALAGYTKGAISFDNIIVKGNIKIEATNSCVGGIVGIVYGTLSVENCKVVSSSTNSIIKGNENGSCATGGIIGYVENYGIVKVNNCRTENITIKSWNRVSGIAGQMNTTSTTGGTSTTISNCVVKDIKVIVTGTANTAKLNDSHVGQSGLITGCIADNGHRATYTLTNNTYEGDCSLESTKGEKNIIPTQLYSLWTLAAQRVKDYNQTTSSWLNTNGNANVTYANNSETGEVNYDGAYYLTFLSAYKVSGKTGSSDVKPFSLTTDVGYYLVDGDKIYVKDNGHIFYPRTEVDGAKIKTTVISKDIKLYELVKTTVSFDSDGGTKFNDVTGYLIGKTVANPGNPIKNSTELIEYEFLYWSLNGKEYDFASKITDDITLVAVYKAKKIDAAGDTIEVIINKDASADIDESVTAKMINQPEEVISQLEEGIIPNSISPDTPVTKEKVDLIKSAKEDADKNIETTIYVDAVVKKGDETELKNDIKKVTEFQDAHPIANETENEIISKIYDLSVLITIKETSISTSSSSTIIENIKLTSIDNSILFTLYSEDIKLGNSIRLIKVHNGVASEVDVDEIDYENHTVSFYANEFSIYSILSLEGKLRIKYDVNQGQILPDTIVEAKKKLEPPVPVRTGYRFIGWYLNKTLTIPFNQNEEISKNMTLYARWQRIPSEKKYSIVKTEVK